MIFDTHCHYNLDPLYETWHKHWATAQENGVSSSIVVGTNLETSEKAIEIVKNEPTLYAAIGIHPCHYQDLPMSNPDLDIEQLETLFSHAKVVAVGETGLDYFRLERSESSSDHIIALQKTAFIHHIKLAEQHALPLIIHVRDTQAAIESVSNAYYDVLALLKEYHSGKQPFILHCVSGPLDYINEALSMGAYIGIAANCTYPKSESIRAIVKQTPKDRILSETDAPFLPPQGMRGKPCEPWMIKETVAYLENELAVDPDQLVANAAKVFQDVTIVTQ